MVSRKKRPCEAAPDTVAAIQQRIAAGEPLQGIARALRVNRKLVQRVANGTHVSLQLPRYDRCPTCRHKVKFPCMICLARAEREKEHVVSRAC